MKVLIYGGKGWIGGMITNELIKQGCNVIFGEARCDDYESLECEIMREMPDRVMSCVGRTHSNTINNIDCLEEPGMLPKNLKDNLLAPINIQRVCHKNSIHCTYIGTGCIYEYTSDKKIFNEQDPPNFYGSSYSIVKGVTDRLMMDQMNTLNIRIRMPITNKCDPRNFITKLMGYKKILSIKNSMSVMPELVPIIVDMSLKKIIGTFNMTNPGTIDHNEILELVKQYVDPNHTWENITVEEHNAMLAKGKTSTVFKRSNNELDTTKLLEMYPTIKNIRDAVIDQLKKYTLE